MDHTSPTWPRRALRAIPSMPDGLLVGVFVFLLFMGGLAVGVWICTVDHGAHAKRLSLQHQLEALEQRLRALEQR